MYRLDADTDMQIMLSGVEDTFPSRRRKQVPISGSYQEPRSAVPAPVPLGYRRFIPETRGPANRAPSGSKRATGATVT